MVGKHFWTEMRSEKLLFDSVLQFDNIYKETTLLKFFQYLYFQPIGVVSQEDNKNC